MAVLADFHECCVVKEDDKVAVIKGSNVTTGTSPLLSCLFREETRPR